MKTFAVMVIALLLAACGGRAEPTAVPVPTFTNTPETAPPTAVIEPTVEQPSRSEPVEIILIATDTPIPPQVIEPTATAAPIIPTDTPVAVVEEPTPEPPPTAVPVIVEAAPPAAVCECGGDQYNCGDFGTHAEAQACHDYCKAITGIDTHKLDGNDGDGLACESLP